MSDVVNARPGDVETASNWPATGHCCSMIRPPPGRSPRVSPTCSPSPSRAGCRSVAASSCARSMRGVHCSACRSGTLASPSSPSAGPGRCSSDWTHDDERLIAGWVHALSSAIGEPAPRDVVEVPADGPTDTVDGAAYQPRVDLLWVTVTAGTMELQGVGDAVIDATSGPLPLSSATWLRSVGTGRIAPEGRRPGRSVLSIASSLPRWRANWRAGAKPAPPARAPDWPPTMPFSMTGSATSSASSRTAPSRLTTWAPASRSADPLLAACRLVGGALGVDVEAPPAWQAGGRDSLAAIARASHLRLRQVTLDGEWWRSASGPMLGFDAGSRRTRRAASEVCAVVPGRRPGDGEPKTRHRRGGGVALVDRLLAVPAVSPAVARRRRSAALRSAQGRQRPVDDHRDGCARRAARAGCADRHRAPLQPLHPGQ